MSARRHPALSIRVRSLPRGLGRALRRGALAAAALSLLAGGALQGVPAQAIQADPDGGSGAYPQVIDWMDWTTGRAVTVNQGGSLTQWSTPTASSTNPATWLSSQCTISETSGRLTAGYMPGTWGGDGLARLYNNGANYSQGNIKGSRAHSGLAIGIANADPGSKYQSRIVTFSVSCRTYLIFSSTKPAQNAIDRLPKREIPIAGLVVADAESSSWESSAGESVTVNSDSGRYRLLESGRTPGCTTNSRGDFHTFTDAAGASHTGLRLRADDKDCKTKDRVNGWGPVSIVFAEGATSVRAQLVATGTSAMAFGVVSYMDFGDAPDSYGAAGAALQPTWSGGLIGTDITRSSEGWFSSSFNFTDAFNRGNKAVAGPPMTRLGDLADAETAPRTSQDAEGDDQARGSLGEAGRSDEDALTSPVPVRANQGQNFRQELACTGPGQVRGWIDWNRDGTFDPSSEASTQAECAGGLAALEWQVPLNAIRSVFGESGSGHTYMRVRISDDRKADGSPVILEPTGVTASGEVEDYRTSVYLPALTLVKTVDATWAGSSVLEASRWHLSATSATDPNAAPVLSGAGGAAQALVLPGTYNLAEVETTPHQVSAGYQPQGWRCYQTPGTVLPEGYTYTSTNGPVSGVGQTTGTVEINNQDRVTCEITNKALPTTLSWSKTDDNGTPLGGSQWSVTPVGANGREGTPVAVTDNSAPDTDPAEGQITVTDLAWGTYRVRETGAPTGYNLSTEVKQGSYNGTTTRNSIQLGAVVNTRITAGATWTKVGQEDQPLEGSQWRLTPKSGGDPLEITDCVGHCSEQSIDRDGNPGVFSVPDLEYGTYTLVETAAPEGYQLDSTSREINITTQDQAVDGGRIVNKRITGTVTWRKFNEKGAALMGTRWRLTPEDPAARPLEITDCVLTCSPQSLDKNTAAGAFTVPDVPYGRYTLVETAAPEGYRLDTTSRGLRITTQGQTANLGGITNERITGTLTWTKVGEEGQPLEGSQWTLTPKGGGDALEITDCVGNCAEQSIDRDGNPGVFRLPDLEYGTYTLVETAAPEGYQLDDTPREARITTQDGIVDLTSITNLRITGTATWTKVADDGATLEGSQWTLTPKGGGDPLEITDCVGNCSEHSIDRDGKPGVFIVPDLEYGTYTLVETAAPAGYRLDATPRELTITTQDETVDLGRIINTKSAVPAIPLTGGRGAHLFLITGGVLSILAALIAIIRRRRRQECETGAAC